MLVAFCSPVKFFDSVQYFRQTSPLWESHVVIREGPLKNGKGANLAPYFYKAAGLSQL